MSESQPTPQTYPDLPATLKARIRDARLRAADREWGTRVTAGMLSADLPAPGAV